MLLYNVLLLASAAERRKNWTGFRLQDPPSPTPERPVPPPAAHFFWTAVLKITFPVEKRAETCVSDFDAEVPFAPKRRIFPGVGPCGIGMTVETRARSGHGGAFPRGGADGKTRRNQKSEEGDEKIKRGP